MQNSRNGDLHKSRNKRPCRDRGAKGWIYSRLYAILFPYRAAAEKGRICMKRPKLETSRLLLRQFEEGDMESLYLLLADQEVNTFLPWHPVKDMEETRIFYETRFKGRKYCFAICFKQENLPVGYIQVSEDDSHDLGYALRKNDWHQGIVSEACHAVVELLKKEGIPYITATHDRNNPRSGAVMKRIGMKYCYSYQEQWQPKDFPVIFRMYQLNFDGQDSSVYRKYWDLHRVHFIETDL